MHAQSLPALAARSTLGGIDMSQEQIVQGVYTSLEDLQNERLEVEEVAEQVAAAASKLDAQHAQAVETLLERK